MKKSNLLNRRSFIQNTALASGALLVPFDILSKNIFTSESPIKNNLEIHLFSKCLQFLDYNETCIAAKEMGFNGLDLTVRPKGHVLPENVEKDLPKATEIMKKHGLTPKMISTSVVDATNATNISVLKTAKKLGYQYYRTGWVKYNRNQSVQENIIKTKKQFTALAKLNSNIGITGAYQNHAGYYVGSPIWDLEQLLTNFSPSNLGSQYDITHARVEGGKNWELGFELIQPHINSLAIKDFKWEKINGKWKVVYTPLGEGMIDFHYYFSLLKKYKINVPISLHVEYDLGGAEKGKIPTMEKSEILKKIRKDLLFIQKIWAEID
ncbi:sugar phosphate isomerase/epimerase family protein [Lutibacter holmesii]|uniref:Sugar phosphate isomerase/epimerase family protein n=1 Tax=Lutibacter holmesii TaxID=1137985 RepID=A0ABW3WQM2_9FLAO